jgi:hypothetical protein
MNWNLIFIELLELHASATSTTIVWSSSLIKDELGLYVSLGRLPASSTQHLFLETTEEIYSAVFQNAAGRSPDQGARACKLSQSPTVFSKRPDIVG